MTRPGAPSPSTEEHYACATGEIDTNAVSVSGQALPGPVVDLSSERPGGTVNAPRYDQPRASTEGEETR